jgi:hypothetical protein
VHAFQGFVIFGATMRDAFAWRVLKNFGQTRPPYVTRSPVRCCRIRQPAVRPDKLQPKQKAPRRRPLNEKNSVSQGRDWIAKKASVQLSPPQKTHAPGREPSLHPPASFMLNACSSRAARRIACAASLGGVSGCLTAGRGLGAMEAGRALVGPRAPLVSWRGEGNGRAYVQFCAHRAASRARMHGAALGWAAGLKRVLNNSCAHEEFLRGQH